VSEIYCPKCGNLLKQMGKYHICDQKHLWDIYQGGYMGWQFRERAIAKCQECGAEYPEFDLHNWEGKKLCDECYEAVQASWRMDKEASFAKLTIEPVISAQHKFYRCDSSITVRPYPNPVTYGGMYGGSSAKDEGELEKVIASFNSEVDRLKKYGMERVEIERLPERVITEQPALAVEAVDPVTIPTTAKPQPQLSLFGGGNA